MGKNKGKNAFYFYLLHTQTELRRSGKDYGINDQRLHDIAGQKWKDMNSEERQPFEEKSKRDKEKRNNAVIPIQPKTYTERQNQTNFGRILTQECHQMDDENGSERYLDEMIKSCVKACKSRDELMSASFFIIATNVMVKTDNNQFPPLEIAVVQYSIKDGIQFTYNQFIDAGPIPLGYAFKAKEHAETFHKIPLQNFYPASNDYKKIVEELIQILDASRFTNELNKKPTPMLVFCRDEAIQQNKGVFDWLKNKYRQYVPSFNWDLEVLDLVNLLFHITNEVKQRVIPAVGEDKLTSSAFDYSPNTNCSFHDEQENKWCAQGLAKRFCYMLSEVLCPIFEISPTENHLPPKVQVVAETYVPVFHDFKPLPNYKFTERAQSSNADNDWAPPPAQQRPESSNSNRPLSRSSETPSRIGGGGIGRGNRLFSRNSTDSNDPRNQRR